MTLKWKSICHIEVLLCSSDVVVDELFGAWDLVIDRILCVLRMAVSTASLENGAYALFVEFFNFT